MHKGAEPDALSKLKATRQRQLTKSGLRALNHGGLSPSDGDHKHTCEKCGFEWVCEEFTKKECEAKGVINAAKVNKEGPWCLMCLHLEMGRRIAFLRGIAVKITMEKIP